MSHVAEHVSRRHDARERRQLVELEQLRPPLLLVAEVDVGAELDGLVTALLAQPLVLGERVARVRVRVSVRRRRRLALLLLLSVR